MDAEGVAGSATQHPLRVPFAPPGRGIDKLLALAVAQGDEAKVRERLHAGAVSLCCDFNSALSMAITEDRPLTRELLQAAGSLDRLDHEALTPLQRAASLGRVEHARQLLAAGAGVDVCTAVSGPLLIACRQAHGNTFPMVRLLLEQGADPYAVTDTGSTALHRAAMCTAADAVAVIERLLDLGLSLEVLDSEGRSPLHYAVLDGRQPATLVRLLQLGAYPHTEDLAGCSPFMYAQKIGGSVLAAFEAHFAAEAIASVLGGTTHEDSASPRPRGPTAGWTSS